MFKILGSNWVKTFKNLKFFQSIEIDLDIGKIKLSYF